VRASKARLFFVPGFYFNTGVESPTIVSPAWGIAAKIGGIFFAPKSAVARFLGTCALAAAIGAFGCLSILPEASAEQELRSMPNAAVIVFDNDYLDRRFGHSRVRETGRPAPNGRGTLEARKTGHAVSEFFGAGFSQIVPNGSLLKGITRGTSPRRAAALRLAESGRRAVQNKQTQKAIYYLEKALSIDASPLVHFYLARAHYQLADYQRSLQFLEVAESALDGLDLWLPELAALRRALTAKMPVNRSNVQLADQRSGR
jgi:hypothetical protein